MRLFDEMMSAVLDFVVDDGNPFILHGLQNFFSGLVAAGEHLIQNLLRRGIQIIHLRMRLTRNAEFSSLEQAVAVFLAQPRRKRL